MSMHLSGKQLEKVQAAFSQLVAALLHVQQAPPDAYTPFTTPVLHGGHSEAAPVQAASWSSLGAQNSSRKQATHSALSAAIEHHQQQTLLALLDARQLALCAWALTKVGPCVLCLCAMRCK